jgi:hypothetical protein
MTMIESKTLELSGVCRVNSRCAVQAMENLLATIITEYSGPAKVRARSRPRRPGCRDPYCEAAIRHTDHVVPFRSGGPTTLANGRGVCARGNYVREMPGWKVDLVSNGLFGRPHTIQITTPTGHRYTSETPQPP